MRNSSFRWKERRERERERARWKTTSKTRLVMRGVHLVILSGNNSLVSDARPLEQPTGGRETHTHTDMEQALQKYFIIVEKKENVAMRIVLAAY